MIKALIQRLIFLFLLISLVKVSSIESTWRLRTSEITALQSIKTPIYFTFNKDISSDGKSTVGYLTITACNVLMYTYDIVDQQIFLTFVSLGRATRNCVNGQISYLRGQLDKTFYFYIMYNTLLLLPGNNDPPIKCDFYVTTPTPIINGIWTITDGVFINKINDPVVVVNGTRIQFCLGSKVFSYKTSDIVKVNVKQVLNNQTCNPQTLQIMANSTAFFRVNTLMDPQTFSLFNNNSEEILELTYRSDFPSLKTINASSFTDTSASNSSIVITNSTLNQTTVSNNVKIGSNTTIKNQSSSGNNSTQAPNASISVNNNANNITSDTKNNSSITSNASDSSSAKVNSSVVQTNNNTNSSQTPNTPNKTINSSQSTSKIADKTFNSTTNLNNPTSISSVSASETLVSQPTSIYGVWYPSSSFLPSQLTASDISPYQLLINGAFLMLRGGCNSIVSPYTFSAGAFTPTKLSITSNSCPGNKDSVLQNIIFNSSNVYYFSGSSPNSIIRIASSNNITQLLLTPTAPSI